MELLTGILLSDQSKWIPVYYYLRSSLLKSGVNLVTESPTPIDSYDSVAG